MTDLKKDSILILKYKSIELALIPILFAGTWPTFILLCGNIIRPDMSLFPDALVK